MPEGLALLIFTPITAITLVALFVVMGVIFPRQIEVVRANSSAMPGRSFLLGLVNVAFLVIIAAALSGGGEFLQIIALIFFALLLIGVAFGLAGMAVVIGERMLPETSATRQTGWGATAMVVASLTPFIGWFLLLPYLSFRGLGALVLGLFNRSSS